MIIIKNGKRMELNGSTIMINDDCIMVDGKRIDGFSEREIKIDIHGDINSLQVKHGAVSVVGSVKGKIDAGGSVSVDGTVGGNIDCGGSCTCGDIGGDVDCGGSCTCGHISGDVDAGGSVITRK